MIGHSDDAARKQGAAARWCILRTSGPKTLALVSALSSAGFDVWTPTRIIRRPIPGQRRAIVMGTTRRLMEVSVPMLSGFVLARADRWDDLLRLSGLREGTNCPMFTVFQFAGEVPLLSEASLAGLREAQAAADEAIAALRTAETREAERRARIELMRTEGQRMKALRSETKRFRKGEFVVVVGASGFEGMVGTIAEDSVGTIAHIDFGPLMTVRAGAWQTFAAMLGDQPTFGAAA